MPNCSRPAPLFVAGAILAFGIVLIGIVLVGGIGRFTPSAGAAEPAGALDQRAARDREIDDLIATLNDFEFTPTNTVKDPRHQAAIEKLRQMGEQAAPAVARMLAEGHKHRKESWLHVYRPLYILNGMGAHAQVALPEVVKALDDGYGGVAKAAAEVLGNLGPAAKSAVPDLVRVWEKSRKNPGRPGATKALADALKKIDPEAAAKAGIE